MGKALGYKAFGNADVQEFFERPDPTPGPSEVLVGDEVTGLSVGDRVTGFALTGAGTYAQTTLLLGESTSRIPDALPEIWAATIPPRHQGSWSRNQPTAVHPTTTKLQVDGAAHGCSQQDGAEE